MKTSQITDNFSTKPPAPKPGPGDDISPLFTIETESDINSKPTSLNPDNLGILFQRHPQPTKKKSLEVPKEGRKMLKA
jgi:hypothetical protein